MYYDEKRARENRRLLGEAQRDYDENPTKFNKDMMDIFEEDKERYERRKSGNSYSSGVKGSLFDKEVDRGPRSIFDRDDEEGY